MQVQNLSVVLRPKITRFLPDAQVGEEADPLDPSGHAQTRAVLSPAWNTGKHRWEQSFPSQRLEPTRKIKQ